MSGMMTPLMARTVPHPEKFGAKNPWRPERIDSLRDLVSDPDLPARMRSKWNEVLSRPTDYILSGPPVSWNFPPYYSDPTGNEAISNMVRTDGRAAVDYAMRYVVLGDENAADQAVKIIQGYSGITSFVNAADSALAFYRRWLLFIQAARLIEGYAGYTSTIEGDFKAATLSGMAALERIAYTRPNNWATVGIAGEIGIAAFLNDRAMFDRAIWRWRWHFDDTIKSGIVLSGAVRNNVPIHEIYREGGGTGNGSNGLVYTNMTLSGFAMGAELARLNGEWLFDHVSPDGSSLKGFYEQTAYWCRYGGVDHSVLWFNTSDQNPSSPTYNQGYGITYLTPWVDILGALWPNEDTNYLMGAYAHNPVQDIYTIRNAELLYRDRPLYG